MVEACLPQDSTGNEGSRVQIIKNTNLQKRLEHEKICNSAIV